MVYTIKTMPTHDLEAILETLAGIYKSKYGTISSGTGIVWNKIEPAKKDIMAAKSSASIADRLMDWKKNSHFWYLGINLPDRQYALNSCKNLLTHDMPWTKTAGYFSYEELYSYIDNLLRQKYISNVVVYDVSLVIAYCYDKRLLPKDVVYVHAKPLDCACNILPMLNPSVFSGRKLRKMKKFKYADTPTCLSCLNAYELEDLFCCLEHTLLTIAEYTSLPVKYTHDRFTVEASKLIF